MFKRFIRKISCGTRRTFRKLKKSFRNHSTKFDRSSKKSELLLTEKNDLDKLLTELSADLATLSESPEVVMERLRDEFVQLVEEEAQISNEIVRNKAEITDLSRRQSEQDESVRENLTKFEKISQDLSEAQENLNTVKKKSRPF